MATTYQRCPNEVEERANRLMRQNHCHLIESSVTITYLFAHSPDGAALSHAGYPAIALVKINSLKDRVAGLADATIAIDVDRWSEMSDESQEAVLDHELQHLDVSRNKAGAIRYDDANRPKLRIRKHDFHLGGFHTIAKRHGKDAVEVQAVQFVQMAWKQMEFEFAAA